MKSKSWKLTMKRYRIYICLWWLLQLCGLMFMTKHLGHLLVDVLLLSFIVGFIFGSRKIALIASFGLAAYSALTLFLSWLIIQLGDFDSWLVPAVVLAIAIFNFVLSFWIINEHIHKQSPFCVYRNLLGEK